MRPRIRRGAECRREDTRRLIGDVVLIVVVGVLDVVNTCLADTTPAEKTKEPTPKSIREVPHVSTLANLRGKTGKSTASMAIHVATIIVPR